MPDYLTERFRALHRLIGNTPLLAIDLIYKGEPRVIYAKYESLNLTGSIKDRMALHILEHAYRLGTIQPGDLIAEATSGNTGMGLAIAAIINWLLPDPDSPTIASVSPGATWNPAPSTARTETVGV